LKVIEIHIQNIMDTLYIAACEYFMFFLY